jgi:hypothetical protein
MTALLSPEISIDIAAGKSDIRTSALAPLTSHTATRSGRVAGPSKARQDRVGRFISSHPPDL